MRPEKCSVFIFYNQCPQSCGILHELGSRGRNPIRRWSALCWNSLLVAGWCFAAPLRERGQSYHQDRPSLIPASCRTSRRQVGCRSSDDLLVSTTPLHSKHIQDHASLEQFTDEACVQSSVHWVEESSFTCTGVAFREARNSIT